MSTRLSLSRGRLTKAVLILSILMGLFACSSKSAEERFKEKLESAEKYVENEKFQEARIELQTAIDIKPDNAEGYYRLAEVLVRLKEFGRALENYNSAINFDPSHKDARIHLASLQLIAKQYEQAENNLDHVLTSDPENEDALVLKSNLVTIGPRRDLEEGRNILLSILKRNPESVSALGSLGHLELSESNNRKAEQYFIEALKYDPSNDALQIALADLYARVGRLDEAQAKLKTLVDENPDEPNYRYVLGEFFLRRGLNDKALVQYEQILEKDPSRHDARDRLFDMYLSRRHIEEAKALYTTLKEHNANDALLPYFEGRNAEVDGDFKTALDLYLKALKGVKNFAPAFRKAGMIEIGSGMKREGLEHLRQAVAIDPADVGARLALGRARLMEGDLGAAKEHIEHVLRRYPRQLGANIIRADIALLENQLDQAKQVYSFLVKTYPHLPIGYYKSGLVAERSGNYEEAITFYEKTLEFDQGSMGAGRRLILMMNQLGKSSEEMISKLEALQAKSKNGQAEFDVLIGSVLIADPGVEDRLAKARKKFTQALEKNPQLIGAYFALGGIDAMTGKLDEAVVNYKKLLESNPGHVPTRMLLALALEQQEKFAEAIEEYHLILDSKPRFGPAANNLAYLISEEMENGDLNEALKLAELAKEELPREPSVADTLGWVHYKKGNPRAALPLLNEAVRDFMQGDPGTPLNPEILYHLAVVQKELGDPEPAKKIIKMAMERAGEKHRKYPLMKKVADSLEK